MKRMTKNLSLATMGLLIFSCNEKISPTLQNGGASTTIPGAPSIPPEYFFKVTNTTPVGANYLLHRTGPNNAAAECKIKTTNVPLSSSAYRGDATQAHDLKTFDITCFMEAEETALFYNGLDFKIEASKNTCEYVAYSPYSFHDAISGSSATNYVGYTCETDGGVVSADIAADATARGVTYNSSFPAVGPIVAVECGYMVDMGLPAIERNKRPIPEDYQQLCAFDYATNGGGNGENCDMGRLNITLYKGTNTTTPPAAKVVAIEPPITDIHTCGGTVTACVGGAIKHVDQISSLASGSVITATIPEVNFDISYGLPKLIGVRGSNLDIVNFRRGLSNKDLDFINYDAANEIKFFGASSFDPSLMEGYAANKNPDGSSIIQTVILPGALTPTVNNATYLNKTKALGWTQIPYAADPFLGTTPRTRVNPFYTFHCLDRALETKARIRMVVREWDRVFPSTTASLTLLSDVYMPAASRYIDLPTDEDEIPGDPGSFNQFDDFYDWDVLVGVKRTGAGPYVPNSGYTWAPATGSGPASWWNPGYFPNQGPL